MPRYDARLRKLERTPWLAVPLSAGQAALASWLVAHGTAELAQCYAVYVHGAEGDYEQLLAPIHWVLQGVPPETFAASLQAWRGALAQWPAPPRAYQAALETWLTSRAVRDRWVDPLLMIQANPMLCDTLVAALTGQRCSQTTVAPEAWADLLLLALGTLVHPGEELHEAATRVLSAFASRGSAIRQEWATTIQHTLRTWQDCDTDTADWSTVERMAHRYGLEPAELLAEGEALLAVRDAYVTDENLRC